jgi:hypothetical protein
VSEPQGQRQARAAREKAQGAMLVPKTSERVTRAVARLSTKWVDFRSAEAQGFPVPFAPERSSEEVVTRHYQDAKDTLLRVLEEVGMGEADLRAVRENIGFIEQTTLNDVGYRLRAWETNAILRRAGSAERQAARPVGKSTQLVVRHTERKR